jgi:hypothetical protein
MNPAASTLVRALALLALAAPLALVAHAAESEAPAEPPETVRWESSVGDVEFAHRMHVEDLGTECVVCHHETTATALEVPHPDYFDDFWVDCGTCHGGQSRTALARCGSCHPERTASGPHVEMPTVKVAIHRSCWSCHESGRGAEAAAGCGACHRRPEPEVAADAVAPAGGKEAR